MELWGTFQWTKQSPLGRQLYLETPLTQLYTHLPQGPSILEFPLLQTGIPRGSRLCCGSHNKSRTHLEILGCLRSLKLKQPGLRGPSSAPQELAWLACRNSEITSSLSPTSLSWPSFQPADSSNFPLRQANAIKCVHCNIWKSLTWWTVTVLLSLSWKSHTNPVRKGSMPHLQLKTLMFAEASLSGRKILVMVKIYMYQEKNRAATL